MLEMIPRSIFSNRFSFRTPDYALVELDVSQWREVATFQLKGDTFAMYREGEWGGKFKLRGDFVLEQNGKVIVRAAKPSVLTSTFSISTGAATFTLKRKFLIGRTFAVLQNGRELGLIRRAELLSRRTLVDLPADWPIALQVFLFWLVLIMWNRGNAIAISAS
jgi:hypothetical protein